MVEHVAIALIQGAETLQRRADGDYGADEVAKRFPAWEPTKRTPVGGLPKIRRGRGPLVYDPKRRCSGAKKPQPKIVAKNVARWMHTLVRRRPTLTTVARYSDGKGQ
jgi:hypothetical protein